jgi:hypothetical protein
MTDVVFAANVPQSARHAVRCALTLCDERGEVIGGMRALQAAMGHAAPSSTRDAVTSAEGHGLMKRRGASWGRRVFVVVSRVFSGATCTTPSCTRTAWKDGRCVSCWNVERADREWRHRAVELAVSGMSPPKIAAHLQQSLFPDVAGHLLAEGLLGEEWATALREATGRKPDPTRAARVRAFRERRRAQAKLSE